MNEKIEVACFQIITYMSTARTHFINAIQRAKEGKYDEATELIEEGEKAFELGIATGSASAFEYWLAEKEDVVKLLEKEPELYGL